MVKDREWYKEMDKVKFEPMLSKSYTGLYDPKKQLIRLNINREAKKIAKTILHELAHHIQYRHLKTFIRYKGVCHDNNFYTILARLGIDCPLSSVISGMEPYPEGYSRWKWINATNSYERVR